MAEPKRWRRPPEDVIAAMYAAQFGRCFYCQQPIVIGKKNHRHERYGTIDHIKPRIACARREIGNPDNVVLACRNCNDAKGHLPVITFLLRLNQTATV